MIHVGIKPKYNVIPLDNKRRVYYEDFPDGTFKLWTRRMLKSGCGKKLDEAVKEMQGCIYCPFCKEYFSKDQWELV